MKEETRKCPVCDIVFKTIINHKRYCCYDHRTMSHNLIKKTELINLTIEEKELRKKLIKWKNQPQ